MTEKVMKNSSDIMKLQLKLENLEGVIEGIEKRLSRMEVEVRTISDVLRSYSAFKQKHKNIEFDWRKTPFQPFTWDDGINNTTKTEGDETTVIEIVEKYLRENKYDGLCDKKHNCCCNVNNLASCGAIKGDCRPAFRVKQIMSGKQYGYRWITKWKDDGDDQQ